MSTKVISVSKLRLFSLDLALPVLAFTIPFFISGPQLLTGSVVNLLLFLTASYSSKKNSIIIALLPSVGALLNGLIFGKFTFYLFYFLPFIWIGNLVLMNSFLKLKKSVPIALDIFISSFAKSGFLFTFALIFFNLKIVPSIFLTAMGVFQLVTALIGGLLFLGVKKLYE